MSNKEKMVVTLGNTHPRLENIVANVKKAQKHSFKKGYCRIEFENIIFRIDTDKFTVLFNKQRE